MSYESLVVFGVIIFMIISLYRELMQPVMIFIIGVLTLGLAGVLTPKEILAGFANEQIAVIILLLLLGEAIRKTGLIDQLFDKVFHGAATYRQFLFRMTATVSALSAFLNNTPLVAVMMPYVHNWTKRGDDRATPSKLLIPLSYAAILGGCATLVGTSTNLIVNSMIAEQQVIPGLRTLGMFEFSWVGVPMIVLGVAYLTVASGWLLPENKDFFADFSTNARQYLIETRLTSEAALAGQTVTDAGLRNLPGLFLAKVIRDGNSITPVHPTLKLRQNDLLLFAGDTSRIADLLHSFPGLEPVEAQSIFNGMAAKHVVEGVIACNSQLENKTIKESNFRSHYDAAVIAVLRSGEKISGKIGSIALKAGDVLLMLAGQDFNEMTRESKDFYILSETRKAPKIHSWKAFIPLLGLSAAIVLSALKLVPLFTSISVVLLIVLFMQIISARELIEAIDHNLVMIIALSLALGMAMIKTSAASMIADGMLSALVPMGKLGILGGIYLITALLGSLMLNKAAVALLFPVVLALAQHTGLNPIGLILTMTFAAAANFISPVGFQTNMMIYGPGGYSFRDFFRIGFPLSVLCMAVTISIISIMY